MNRQFVCTILVIHRRRVKDSVCSNKGKFYENLMDRLLYYKGADKCAATGVTFSKI
jgi:hypothetical protein